MIVTPARATEGYCSARFAATKRARAARLVVCDLRRTQRQARAEREFERIRFEIQLSREREDQERPCLHRVMVELIDDFFAEYRATAASDKVIPMKRMK